MYAHAQCNTVVHVKRSVCDCGHAFASKKRKARCTTVGEFENAMKRGKAILSEEELLVTKERDKVCKVSKRASENMWADFAQGRTEPNTSSLCRGFSTSVLFIIESSIMYLYTCNVL